MNTITEDLALQSLVWAVLKAVYKTSASKKNPNPGSFVMKKKDPWEDFEQAMRARKRESDEEAKSKVVAKMRKILEDSGFPPYMYDDKHPF